MNVLFAIVLGVLMMAAAGAVAETAPAVAARDAAEPRAAAVRAIDKAVKEKPSNETLERQIEELRGAARDVLELTPQNALTQANLTRALEESTATATAESVRRLREALLAARETLAFKLVKEAPLPEGFPEPTPVGEIRVQEYPAYRRAETKMAEGEGPAFWTLFQHIQTKQIAMTAPVEMTYKPGDSSKPRASAMAFLYADTNLGRPGASGAVSVVDVPAATAVSLGLRGDITAKAVAAAAADLERWLADHADQYEAAGELRVLGYNSPMVPAAKRYFEVQRPVREVDASLPAQ